MSKCEWIKCENCIHDQVCEMIGTGTMMGICSHYKPKSLFVELPCKVGDKVYVITTDSPTGIEETNISQVVVRFKGNSKMQYSILAPCVYDDWGKAKWSFCDNDFGKTVFLDRAEAEKKLKEVQNG